MFQPVYGHISGTSAASPGYGHISGYRDMIGPWPEELGGQGGVGGHRVLSIVGYYQGLKRRSMGL